MRIFRFWLSKGLSSTSEMESWLTKIGKMLLVLSSLDIPTCPSTNFYQGLKWRWYIFKYLSIGIISDFVPYIGILINWTYGSVPLIFLFRRFSDSKIFEAFGLNSSAEVSIEFFGNIGLFLNVICCMFAQFSHAPYRQKLAQGDCASCFEKNLNSE